MWEVTHFHRALRPRVAEMLATLEERTEDAARMGVNCILLPAGIPQDMARRIEAAFGGEARILGDYVAFTRF